MTLGELAGGERLLDRVGQGEQTQRVAHVRTRPSQPRGELLVSHAERSFIEEVHFGLTPEESRRLVWDIAWVWGPPEDHLTLLLETIGIQRFVFGTGMPLRIPDTPFAKLDLLGLSNEKREMILSGNLERWQKG